MHWHVIHAVKLLMNSLAQFWPRPKNVLPAQAHAQTEGEPGPGTLPDGQLAQNCPPALEGSVVMDASRVVLICLGAIEIFVAHFGYWLG